MSRLEGRRRRLRRRLELALGRLKRRVAHERRRSSERPEPRTVRPASAEGLRALATLRELLTLAWPIAAAMGGETLMGLVDTKLVGGLGAASLGGVGLASTFMFLGYSIAFGTMRGVKVRVAWAIGQRRSGDAPAYAEAGLLIGAAFGLVVFALGRNIEPVLRALAVQPELVAPARDFFRAVTFGAPATAMLAALVQHRQAIGDSRTPMLVGLSGNVVNAGLAWLLIHRTGLGVSGAGYATATVQWLELAALGGLFAVEARRARASAASTSTSSSTSPSSSSSPAPIGRLAAAREIADLGLPTGIQFGAETLAFVVFSSILGTMPSSEIAAHQIALAAIRCSFLPGVAVGEAASVLVGRALGRASVEGGALAEGNPMTAERRRRGARAADRVTRAALKLAVGFMSLCGLVFLFGGASIARAFTDDAAVIATTRRLLVVAAVFQVLDAVNIVFRSALRGAKDVRTPAVIGVVIVWTCVPCAAWLLGERLGYGALGGWLGFVAETTLGAAAMAWRWRRAPFRPARARVLEPAPSPA